MSRIATKTIPKASHDFIKRVEKELEDASDIYIDPKINQRVENEISHLGKEKLIVDHVYDLTKKFDKSHKNKILFLLVKLYNFNKQVHESLARELKKDKKLLNSRIKTKIEKNNVHKDLYKKLLKIANAHYEIVKSYAKNFDPKIKYNRRFILNIIYHKRRAETIYKSLINVKMRKTLHKVLLMKLDKVYQSLIEFTVQLANRVSLMAKEVKSNKFSGVREKALEIHAIVSNKIALLRSFAYKYTFNIIHHEHFFDFDNNKIVLITKKAHSLV